MSNTLIKADVDLTLMILNFNGDYQPSSVMTYQYFIAADEDFTANLLENTKNLMVNIYNQHYQIFRQREPNDPNYIAVVSVSPSIIEPKEYPNEPWLDGNSPIWEESNCIGITQAGYHKLSPNFFAGVLKLS